MTQTLVFVDTRVADSSLILSGLPADSECYLIDMSEDGMTRMQAVLSNYSDLASVHIVSHGAAGRLLLGSTQLDLASLPLYDTALQTMGKSLSEGGDILLYGCNVAQGAIGLEFLQSLAQHTQADVAASSDSTGPQALSGNSALEVTVGAIETAPLVLDGLSELLVANTAPRFGFRGDGMVSTANGSPSFPNSASSLVLQPDGKIVLAGYGYNNGYSNFALVRYLRDGRIDLGFSSDGVITTAVGSSNSLAQSVALQPDGKIVVVGSSYNGNNNDFAIVRYNTDGGLDATFSGDGMLSVALGSSTDIANSVALQPDGKIIVVGSSTIFDVELGFLRTVFAVARFNADGTADTLFSDTGSGNLTTAIGSSDSSSAGVVLQPDGKILLFGNSGRDFALVRYNVDGSLDTSFSGDGKLTTAIGVSTSAASAALQTDEKIVVAGTYYVNGFDGLVLVRYNIDGSLDSSFSGGGIVTNGSMSATSLALQTDGKIVVAGSSYGGDFALQRYNIDGSLDTSFSGDGMVITTLPSSSDYANSVKLQSDGKIVVAGSSGNTFAVFRYNADGSLDTTFDADSTVDAFVSYIENAAPIALDSSVVISDAELNAAGNYGGSSIALSRQGGAQAEDLFSSSLQALTEGGDFLVSGVVVGSVTKASAGVVRITFNANATQVLVNQVLSAFEYRNTADAPPASVQLEWRFSDGNTSTQGEGGAMAATTTTTVFITAVNDLPSGNVTIGGTATQGQTLTATNTLADVDGLGTISYQWRVDGVDISGATSSIYTLKQSDVNRGITVLARYTDGTGTVESVSSTATSAVANINDLPTGTVSISGTATQGQTLTATNTLADADGLGAVGYQWRADGVDISGATSSTYSLKQSDVSKTITVLAHFTDGFGAAESVSSSATSAVANINDLPTGTVTIIGAATQGQSLTVTNTIADVDGLGLVSYQWRAAGLNISGAISNTLTLTQADVGKAITVVANYTDSFGKAESLSSAATITVANVNDLPTGGVTISGTSTQGQILTATNTLSDVDGLGTVGYQWQAAGVSISGATSATYTLKQSDVGVAITVVAGYTDGFGVAERVISSATTAVANVNDLPTGNVTISGVAIQGQTLTATNTLADADGLGVISYQWRADGTQIQNATGSTYTLTQSEVGKSITVVANYPDGFGKAESVISSATSAVININDLNTGTVTISGVATQGQVLIASNSLADVDGVGLIGYQWRADGSNISGATGSTLTLTQAQVGKVINVVASYTDGFGVAESQTSSATLAVVNVNDLPTGSVTINGTSIQGQVLTVSSTLTDADGLGVISYQWLSAGVNISGATGITDTLKQTDVGKAITVVANYTDGFGKAESVSSAATDAVTRYNTAPSLTAPLAATYTDTAGTDSFSTSSGTLLASDAENDALMFGIQGVVDGLATSVSLSGLYGTLMVNKASGAWTYTPDGAAMQALDSNASESFTVTVSDGLAVTSQTLAVNINATVDIPTLTSKYFLLAGSGVNHVDYQLKASPLSLQGQYISQAGTTGVDTIHVRAGSAIDFTNSGASADMVYLDGAYGDYGVSLTGTVMTLYRGSGASRELVRVSKAASLVSSDLLVYADGSVSAWDLFNLLKSGTQLPSLGSETSLQPLGAAAPGSTLSATIKAFALDSGGETFASVGAGMQLIAVGSVGVDTVYVGDGSTVDATLLGASSDLIYLRGNWGDYSKSVAGSVLTFSRLVSGQTESVKVIGGNGALNDKLIFADGAVLSNNAKLALNANLNAAIETVTGYDPNTTTPGLRPMLQASALDNVSNLDVSSDIVLRYSESVTAQAGKYIRIVDDGGAGFRGESSNHTQLIAVTDSTQLSIVGGKVTFNPTFDLDLASNYHIEIDAGAFVGQTSGQATEAYNGSTSLNFSTVTPGTGTVANAVASQAMDSNAAMVAGHNWLDIEGTGSPSSSAVALDLAGGNYALVAKDYDASGGNSSTGYDGIQLGDLNVALNNFALGDLVYIDDQINNLNALNDVSFVSVLDQGTAPTLIQFAGTNLGGVVEVSLFGTTATFDSVALLNQLVGGTAVITA